MSGNCQHKRRDGRPHLPVYLERRLELIADRGVLKSVPALKWNQVLFELHEAGTSRNRKRAGRIGASRRVARQTSAGNRQKSERVAG